VSRPPSRWRWRCAVPADSPIRDRPILIYDGDCHFCRRWIARWREATGERVDYAPYQEAAPGFPQIPEVDFRASVQLIETDGRVFTGAEAALRALSHAPRRGWLLTLYQRLPGAAAISEASYRLVARHRMAFSRITRWLWGSHLERPSHFLTRWLFLRLLGVIYLVAFLSLGVQIAGLVGEKGLLPSGRFLEALSASMGSERFRLVPTLCWLNGTDGFLHFLWIGGAVLSGLLIVGLAPGPVLVLLWAFYLSLAAVCREFLSFQWDVLLLETGFLAIFFAPWRFLPGVAKESPPSSVALGLLRWLLFRLMFASGVVKLASGDPTWWGLTALQVHYETQPLPTWIGWYAHQLPLGLHRASAALMFVVELAVPFLILFPRRPRALAAAAIVGFMILIGLTGNYGFFNLLAVALAVMLLDDAFLAPFFPRRMRPLAGTRRTPGRGARLSRIAAVSAAILLVPLSCMALGRSFRRPLPWPEPLRRYEAWLAPLRLVSGYGLFANMTTTRNEIVVEGSADGAAWLPYEFRWKPGDPARPPAFVEPHMPRLDWQMWFAALSDARSNPWFQNFMVRLLQGSEDVTALLAANPFPNQPPRYVRARLVRYQFTDFAGRRASGHWWTTVDRGIYFPPASLRAPGS
jgi:predicted DCC family thiol-disulfide oxidoreductase YuxK